MVYQVRSIELPPVKAAYPEKKTCHGHTKLVLDWLEAQSHLFPVQIKDSILYKAWWIRTKHVKVYNRCPIPGNKWQWFAKAVREETNRMDGDGYMCDWACTVLRKAVCCELHAPCCMHAVMVMLLMLMVAGWRNKMEIKMIKMTRMMSMRIMMMRMRRRRSMMRMIWMMRGNSLCSSRRRRRWGDHSGKRKRFEDAKSGSGEADSACSSGVDFKGVWTRRRRTRKRRKKKKKRRIMKSLLFGKINFIYTVVVVVFTILFQRMWKE